MTHPLSLLESRASYNDYDHGIIRQSLCSGWSVGSNNGRLVCSLNILTILSWRRWQQKPQNPLSTCLLFYNRRLTESRHCTMPLSFTNFRSRPCNRICSESTLQGIKDKTRKRASSFAWFERCLGIPPQLFYGHVDTAIASRSLSLGSAALLNLGTTPYFFVSRDRRALPSKHNHSVCSTNNQYT